MTTPESDDGFGKLTADQLRELGKAMRVDLIAGGVPTEGTSRWAVLMVVGFMLKLLDARDGVAPPQEVQ